MENSVELHMLAISCQSQQRNLRCPEEGIQPKGEQTKCTLILMKFALVEDPEAADTALKYSKMG